MNEQIDTAPIIAEITKIIWLVIILMLKIPMAMVCASSVIAEVKTFPLIAFKKFFIEKAYSPVVASGKRSVVSIGRAPCIAGADR